MKMLLKPRQTKISLAYCLTLGTLLTALLACSQARQNSPTPKPSVSAAEYQAMRVSFNALEGNWLLTTYQNAPLPQDLQNKALLRLTRQSADLLQVVGSSFVNGYGGTARLDEEKGLIIVTDGIVRELVASPNDALNKAEVRYFDHLSKAKAFELTDSGQIRIYSGERINLVTEVMVFTRK